MAIAMVGAGPAGAATSPAAAGKPVPKPSPALHARMAPAPVHVAPRAPSPPRTYAAPAAPMSATPQTLGTITRTFTVNSATDTHDATAGDGVCKDAADACTLRAAIEEANADTGTTQINVPAATTILLDSGFGPLAPTASMFITGGGSTTVIDGQNATQVFNIDDSETNPAVTISNLTVQNGTGSYGGNIEVGYAALTLTDVLVKGGQASYGGGIYAGYYGTLWLGNSTVDDNEASDYGGGLYLDGSAFITGSTVSNNTADTDTYTYGGGIYISSGQVTLENSTVSGNTSGYEGGGIYTDEVLRMTGGSLSNNKVDGGTSRSAYGAAIENDYTASLTGVTIADNTATGTYVEGGAIYNSGAFSLVNSAIKGTTSTVGSDDTIDGGVISNDGENFTMQGGSISGTTNGVAGTPAYIYGGVVYSYEPTTLTGVSISDTTNYGDDQYVEGGVAYQSSYSLTASSTSVANTTNTADTIYGGVFYLDDNSTLLNNSVKATTNDFGSYLEGGVLYNNYYLNLNGLTVDGTSSTSPASASGGVYGGVISNNGDDSNLQNVSMTNTTVSVAGSSSYVYGGAFYNDYPVTVDRMQAIGTTVSADDYVYGGLLSNKGDHMTITNSTFAKADVTVTGANSAATKKLYGSAAYIYYGTNMVNVTFANVAATVPPVPGYDTSTIDLDDDASFTNVTVANNTITGATDPALMHSGIWFDTTGYTASFKNTIVSNTPVAHECGIDGGTSEFISAGHNLENGTTCGFTNAGDQQSTSPKVAPVANNGGAVQTAALAAGSPAIDGGTSAGAPATDARGVARPQGAGVDIGAYEVQPSAISFGSASRAVQENAGKLLLTVTRTHPQTAASVKYSLGNGTATRGSDFTMATGTLYFAPGVASKTIPVTIINDARAENPESIIVKLSSPSMGSRLGAHPTMTLTIEKSDQRPDAMVSKHRSYGYRGDDVYNRTGLSQTRYATAQRNEYRDFFVRVYNDGTTSDTFVLKGIWGEWRAWVHFFAHGQDVTVPMRSGSGVRVRLAAGEYYQLRIRVGIWSNASIGTVVTPGVIATWQGDGVRADVVEAGVTIVR
jgi:CSLREA domain-containing protein